MAVGGAGLSYAAFRATIKVSASCAQVPIDTKADAPGASLDSLVRAFFTRFEPLNNNFFPKNRENVAGSLLLPL